MQWHSAIYVLWYVYDWSCVALANIRLSHITCPSFISRILGLCWTNELEHKTITTNKKKKNQQKPPQFIMICCLYHGGLYISSETNNPLKIKKKKKKTYKNCVWWLYVHHVPPSENLKFWAVFYEWETNSINLNWTYFVTTEWKLYLCKITSIELSLHLILRYGQQLVSSNSSIEHAAMRDKTV